MKRHWLFLFCALLIWSCRSTQITSTTVQRTIKFVQLDSLVVEDLSEDMSRLSTQEDEIYLLAFWHNDSLIYSYQQSPLLEFSRTTPSYPLEMEFSPQHSNDRLTCFLIELDEEQLSGQIGEYCAQAIKAPNFPMQFQQDHLDSLIGDDDLLGMRTIKPAAAATPNRLTFRGRQLFDPFVYHLYWSITTE